MSEVENKIKLENLKGIKDEFGQIYYRIYSNPVKNSTMKANSKFYILPFL